MNVIGDPSDDEKDNAIWAMGEWAASCRRSDVMKGEEKCPRSTKLDRIGRL